MEIHDILESLCTVEGVVGAFLIEPDGNMFDSVTRNTMDVDYIADLVHRCVNSGKMIANSFYNSPLKQSYVELSDSSLTVDLLNNGRILALLASSGANLGRIRLEIRKTKKAVERQLA